jgi:hypothetical protein
VVNHLWRRISSWLGLDFTLSGHPKEILAWLDGLSVNKKKKRLLEGIFFCAWWTIWKIRNEIVQNHDDLRHHFIFYTMVFFAHSWITARDRKLSMSMSSWLHNPFCIFNFVGFSWLVRLF